MNILFYRYGSICEEDILDCFRQSGHMCVTIEKEITNKKITGKETIALVNEELSKNSYDCVFTINFYPAISDLCNIYHIRYICWIVDCPVLELFSLSIRNPWNRVFIFDRAQYDEISKFNPDCVFHYPLAVDVESKQKAISAAKSDGRANRYRTDVSFIGSLYTEKDPLADMEKVSRYARGYIDGLCEAQLRVYGYYFVTDRLTDKVIEEFKTSMPDYYQMKSDSLLTDKVIIGQYYMGNHITAMERQRLIAYVSERSTIDVYTRSNTNNIPKANCKGGCETLTEMPVIFNESKININPTSKAIRTGIPLRVFDIFACEGFMIGNYQEELCELFVPGEDFVYYDSIEQIPELIDYYLNHETERKEIAHNAYVKIRKEYSYYVRLNRLLLTAFSV